MWSKKPEFGMVKVKVEVTAIINLIINFLAVGSGTLSYLRFITSTTSNAGVKIFRLVSKTSQKLRMLSLSQAIHNHKVILNNAVLNCHQCNQCLKCHM